MNIDRKKSVNLLLIVFLVLSIWLFSSFLAAIVFGAFLTFIFSPLQDRFTFIKDKDYRSAFITFLTIFIILLIIYFITQSFFFKIDNSINTIQKYARGEITTCEGDFLCDIVIKFDALRDDITAQRYLSDIFNSKNKSGSGFLENSFNETSGDVLEYAVLITAIAGVSETTRLKKSGTNPSSVVPTLNGVIFFSLR